MNIILFLYFPPPFKGPSAIHHQLVFIHSRKEKMIKNWRSIRLPFGPTMEWLNTKIGFRLLLLIVYVCFSFVSIFVSFSAIIRWAFDNNYENYIIWELSEPNTMADYSAPNKQTIELCQFQKIHTKNLVLMDFALCRLHQTKILDDRSIGVIKPERYYPDTIKLMQR